MLKIIKKHSRHSISITKSSWFIRLVVDGKMKINVYGQKIPKVSGATQEQINQQVFIGRLYSRYLSTDKVGYDQALVDDVTKLLERIS